MRHYRMFNGNILCGNPSTKLDATSAEEGVTCQHCNKILSQQKKIATAIHEEEEAIADYRRDANKADPKTAKLFRHIAKDEIHHKKELRNRLKQIK